MIKALCVGIGIACFTP
ncbi:hypothetical protein NB614_20755 [Vibrio parahaemolyticus]|nr:hypothetical protein [Vibrio parahaemolyticus]MCR9877043.1 hypothetical protein [Vibrio parahaemolyticus]MDS1868805.1 hypothetical protein [Vibrio parahaemolyticus]